MAEGKTNLIDKRTAIVVGTSTVLGFIGDTITYSIAASKGGKLRFHMPKGKALFNIIWIGIVTGILIDMAIKAIEDSQKPTEERKLDALADSEKKRIAQGALIGKSPTAVVWV